MTNKQKAPLFVGEKRKDGSVYVTSPDLPFFHYIVSSTEKDWMESKELDFMIQEFCFLNNIELEGTIIMEKKMT